MLAHAGTQRRETANKNGVRFSRLLTDLDKNSETQIVWHKTQSNGNTQIKHKSFFLLRRRLFFLSFFLLGLWDPRLAKTSTPYCTKWAIAEVTHEGHCYSNKPHNAGLVLPSVSVLCIVERVTSSGYDSGWYNRRPPPRLIKEVDSTHVTSQGTSHSANIPAMAVFRKT